MARATRPGVVTRAKNASQHPGHVLLYLKRARRASTKTKKLNQSPTNVPETAIKPALLHQQNGDSLTIEQFARLCLQGLQLPQTTETIPADISPMDPHSPDQISLRPTEVVERLPL